MLIGGRRTTPSMSFRIGWILLCHFMLTCDVPMTHNNTGQRSELAGKKKEKEKELRNPTCVPPAPSPPRSPWVVSVVSSVL